MLSFQEKVKIIQTFAELERNDISFGRVNYHYPDSRYDKKIVVYRLHPNGNGFVFTGLLDEYVNEWTNIRDASEAELIDLVQTSIESLSLSPAEKDPVMEEWLNKSNEPLVLLREEDGYAVYADDRLEGFFNSYKEAAEFLKQEGFHRI